MWPHWNEQMWVQKQRISINNGRGGTAWFGAFKVIFSCVFHKLHRASTTGLMSDIKTKQSDQNLSNYSHKLLEIVTKI